MNETGFHTVYGPVPSRRLGLSLGVDIVPFKTCTYDCIYCQLGRTTNKTLKRKEYVKVETVLLELEQKLKSSCKPNFITLAGSGEPTLNIKIDNIINKIKKITDIPIAVMTNGSLLWKEEVQQALMSADLVLPSLDAGDEWMFQIVNRPCRKISFEQMVCGLIAFTHRFPGSVWLEVMLIPEITCTPSHVQKIVDLCKKINPERIQLNTVTRPPPESFIHPVSQTDLESLADFFKPRAEIISDYKLSNSVTKEKISSTPEEIQELLFRRPCTLEEIAEGLNLPKLAVIKELEMLMKKGKIGDTFQNGKHFYIPKKKYEQHKRRRTK